MFLFYCSYKVYRYIQYVLFSIYYISFGQLYGQHTTDTHRPGAQPLNIEDEHDRHNRDVFKNSKVRDCIVCGECLKPRCVYSQSKLTRDQV